MENWKASCLKFLITNDVDLLFVRYTTTYWELMTLFEQICLKCKGNPSYQDDYWDARQGNAQSRITFHLCREKTKWQTKLPEGFTCPIPPSMELILRGGNGSFQVVWRTHLEVDLKRTQNYWAELLALYYIHAIRLSKYGIRMRKLTCARGSCKNNTLPRFPREMLQLVAVLSLRVKSLSFSYWNFRWDEISDVSTVILYFWGHRDRRRRWVVEMFQLKIMLIVSCFKRLFPSRVAIHSSR